MDAFNALYSVTYEIDEAHASTYHDRLRAFLTEMHRGNLVVGGAMTDTKGDRSLAPHQQADPDLYVHVTRRSADGIWISGAKAHQTGCLNSHWLIVMPTMRMSAADRDYAIVGAVRPWTPPASPTSTAANPAIPAAPKPARSMPVTHATPARKRW